MEEKTNDREACQNSSVMPVYTHFQELVHNIPYIAMCVLGAAVMLVALGVTFWGVTTAIAFIAYGILGAVWIMIFVCPYCGYWNTRSCPCGYGRIAAKFRQKACSSLAGIARFLKMARSLIKRMLETMPDIKGQTQQPLLSR